MKVREFMVKNVIVAQDTDTVKEVMDLFVQNKIGGAPVVNKEGKIVGMISDGDLLRFINPNEESIYDFFTFMFYNPKEELLDSLKRTSDKPVTKAAKLREVVSLHEDEDMEKALAILAKYHFKKIPVVDKDKKVVGLISRGDVLREIKKLILK